MSVREALESAGSEIGMEFTPAEPLKSLEPEIEETDDAEIEAEGQEPETDSEPKEAAPKSPEPEAKTQPKQEPSEPEKAPEAQAETVEAPQFWSAERKALWSKVPVEAQKAVLDYENQRNAWANRITNEVAGVRQSQKQLDAVIEPHIERLKVAQIKPVEAIEKLLNWSDILDDDNTRIQGFNRLLASYGLTPEHLLNGQEVEQVDPVYSQLSSELSDLKKWKEEQERHRQQQEAEYEQRNMLSEIETVKAEKNERGQSKFPMFEFFTPHIAQIIPQLKASNPLASNADVIRVAYAEVSKQFPQIAQPAPQPVQQPADKQRVDRAQRAAKLNVSSRPTTEVPSRPKNAREALREAAHELGLA